jgi:superfamily II DNA or RNA helicase
MTIATLPDTVRMGFPGVYSAEKSLDALLDMTTTQWRQFVSDKVIKRALDWYRSNRITEFEANDESGSLLAYFDTGAKGESSGGLLLTVSEGQLRPRYEHIESATLPSREDMWSAAIAAVMRFQASRHSTSGQIRNAAELARADRAKRALTGIATEAPLSGQTLGLWHAWSVGAWRPGVEKYQVFLRSLKRRVNGCTCPDFQNNELGTCKHIEAVLVQARHMRTDESLPWITMFRGTGDDDAYGVQAPADREREVREVLGDYLATAACSFLEDEQVWVWSWTQLDRDAWAAIVARLSTLRRVHAGREIELELQRWSEEVVAERRRVQVLQELEDWDGTFPWLNATLYPYQLDGVRHLASLGCGMIGDAMGLGKTIQAITAFRYLMDRGEARHVLVVCPTTLMSQWQKEIETFTGMQSTLLAGGKNARAKTLRTRPTILITSYERLVRDIGGVIRYYRPDVMVADEAQKFRNFETKAANAVGSVPARFRFLLSGTAMENKLTDFYSLMRVVNPTIFGPLWRFNQEFHVLDSMQRPIVARNLDVLRAKASRAFLRRTRDLIADQLPERQDITYFVPMTELQKELHGGYESVIGKLAAIASQRPLSPAEQKRLQAAILGVRRACNHAGLLMPGITEAPKVELLTELLEQLCVDGGEKVVVFSEWVTMGKLAYAAADAHNLGYLHLTGSVPAAHRPALIEKFLTNPDIQVLFASDAGATGLNLQAASAVIHLDQPWNPAVLAQRSGRVHRLGQRRSVKIFSIVSQDSYELHVMATQRYKATIGDAALNASSEVNVVGATEEQAQELADYHAAVTYGDEEAQERSEKAISARMKAFLERLNASEAEYDETPEPDEEGSQDAGDDDTTPGLYEEGGEAGSPLAGERTVKLPLLLEPESLAAEDAEDGATAELNSPDLSDTDALIRPDAGVRTVSAASLADPGTDEDDGVDDDVDGEDDEDDVVQAPAPSPKVPRLHTTSQPDDHALVQSRKLHYAMLNTMFAAGHRKMALQQLVTAEVLTLAARAGVAPPSDPMETSVWLFGTVATQGIVAIERAMLLSTASMTLGMWAKDEPAGVSELWSALAA